MDLWATGGKEEVKEVGLHGPVSLAAAAAVRGAVSSKSPVVQPRGCRLRCLPCATESSLTCGWQQANSAVMELVAAGMSAVTLQAKDMETLELYRTVRRCVSACMRVCARTRTIA